MLSFFSKSRLNSQYSILIWQDYWRKLAPQGTLFFFIGLYGLLRIAYVRGNLNNCTFTTCVSWIWINHIVLEMYSQESYRGRIVPSKPPFPHDSLFYRSSLRHIHVCHRNGYFSSPPSTIHHPAPFRCCSAIVTFIYNNFVCRSLAVENCP